MFKQGTWWDKHYDACSLQGTRRKKQRIRHDVDEINRWPDMRCRHIHHPQEWIPQVDAEGRTWYPSKEEAEYTACLVFHIVHSVSAWACRVGRAKLIIPKMPAVECTGDRREWLKLDARAARSWAMIPTALASGLHISTLTTKASHGVIPTRHRIKPGQALGVDEIYIGHGHHSHNHKASKWASPFKVGQHGTAEECLLKYMDYIATSALSDTIEELINKKLLSDTPAGTPCTTDALISMMYCAWGNNALAIIPTSSDTSRRVQLTPNATTRKKSVAEGNKQCYPWRKA